MGGKTEACFEINLLRADVEGQIEDLRQILLQKCDSSTVDEVIAYVSQRRKENTTCRQNIYMITKAKDIFG